MWINSKKINKNSNKSGNPLEISANTIYGWLNRGKTGRCACPNDLQTVEFLAEALEVDLRKLLYKDAFKDVDQIIESEKEDWNQMTPEEILVRVAMSYVNTNGYSYVSDTDDEDGQLYWASCVDTAIQKIIKQDLAEEKTKKLLALSIDIKSFISSFEYADGLSENLIRANPNLKYYTSPFELMDESMEVFVRYGSTVKYLFVPTTKEIIERYKYFERIREMYPDRDNETLFMYELAETIRKVFNGMLDYA